MIIIGNATTVIFSTGLSAASTIGIIVPNCLLNKSMRYIKNMNIGALKAAVVRDENQLLQPICPNFLPKEGMSVETNARGANIIDTHSTPIRPTKYAPDIKSAQAIAISNINIIVPMINIETALVCFTSSLSLVFKKSF